MNSLIEPISILLSLGAIILVYFQVRVAIKSNRSHIMISHIDHLYKDPSIQSVLSIIYAKQLRFKFDKQNKTAMLFEDNTGKEVTEKVDLLLNRLQIIGHLVTNKILNHKDLLGIRFEIIAVGRDSAIREYLCYCNTVIQSRMGIIHDHFAYYKKLYIAFEYDSSEKKAFKSCLFSYSKGMHI